MTEKFLVNVPESAEHNYEMDSHETRAFPFAQDPVGYLKKILENAMDHGHDEQSALYAVIDEFLALVVVVADGDVKTENQNLATYIYSDNAYSQKRAFISLLHDVGIKRECLQEWADVGTSDSKDEELLEEKSYGFAIAEIYGI